MASLILYKIFAVVVLGVVALWSFYAVPEKPTVNSSFQNVDQKANLGEKSLLPDLRNSDSGDSASDIVLSPIAGPVSSPTPTNQIIKPTSAMASSSIQTSTPNPTVLIAPSSMPKITPALPSSALATPISTSTPTPTVSISPTSTSSPNPTPSTGSTSFQPSQDTTAGTTSQASPEPTGSPQATPTPISGHIFYLSTYRTAKYYYCDTDNGWKSLSEKYLKSYPSEQELLADYPTRTFHEPCK